MSRQPLDGHIGIGQGIAETEEAAIDRAMINGKLSIVPVRRDYFVPKGDEIAKPHTVPYPLTGELGSTCVYMIPAPRGTGILHDLDSPAPVPKKMIEMAGISDCLAIAYWRSGPHTSPYFWATYQALSRSWSSSYAWLPKLCSTEPFEGEWVPATKLGRLVRDGVIKSLFTIYVNSMRIEEPEIVDLLFGPALKVEVLNITQETRAGQRTMFRALVGELQNP